MVACVRVGDGHRTCEADNAVGRLHISGVLLKEMRPGEWLWSETTEKVWILQKELCLKAQLDGTRCIREICAGKV